MIIPKGFKKEYLNRKTGGARFAGVPQVPSNDPKHVGVEKDWLKKFMERVREQRQEAGLATS